MLVLTLVFNWVHDPCQGPTELPCGGHLFVLLLCISTRWRTGLRMPSSPQCEDLKVSVITCTVLGFRQLRKWMMGCSGRRVELAKVAINVDPQLLGRSYRNPLNRRGKADPSAGSERGKSVRQVLVNLWGKCWGWLRKRWSRHNVSMVHGRMWKQNPRDQENSLSLLKDEERGLFVSHLQAFSTWPSLSLLNYVAVIRHADKNQLQEKWFILSCNPTV